MPRHLLVVLFCALTTVTALTARPLENLRAESPGHAAHRLRHASAGAPAVAFADAMHKSMVAMMEDMEQSEMTGNPDQDFLAMMIPHHEGAVEMARLLLIYGKDPLVRRLAEEIIAGQQAEITAMRARLAILKKGADPDPGGFPAVHGTRGPAASLTQQKSP